VRLQHKAATCPGGKRSFCMAARAAARSCGAHLAGDDYHEQPGPVTLNVWGSLPEELDELSIVLTEQTT
jgi:hypothetical protein